MEDGDSMRSADGARRSVSRSRSLHRRGSIQSNLSVFEDVEMAQDEVRVFLIL